MTRLLQDLRFGLRSFGKAPGFTAVAVLVLGLGIGANSALFTLVNSMLLRPLTPRDATLYGVYSHDRTRPDSYRAFSYPNYADLREHNEIFDGLLAHTFAMVGVPAGDRMRRTFVELVSSNYFDTLGVKLAAGRPFTEQEERPGAHLPVVIVTYQRWTQENLNPAFIGSTVRFNSEDFTVVGVTPEGFNGTMAMVAAEAYLPLGMFEAVVNDMFKDPRGTGLDDRSNPALVVAGYLKPGLDPAAAAPRLDTVSRRLEAAYPAENKQQLVTISPSPRMSTSTSPQTDTGLGAFAALLMGLSGVVLLIASLNIANMLLARGTSRRKEVALRLALGANRGRVIRQLLTESLLLAIGGAALGLGFGYWAMRALVNSFASVLPMPVAFSAVPDVNVILATTIFAVASTLIFGLGPAMKLSRRDLVGDLKDLGQNDSGRGRWFGARNLLVVGQVSLSLALLTAGGLFARSALKANVADPGYRYDHLLLASLDPSLASMTEPEGRSAYRALLDRLRALPGVEEAGMSSSVPFGDMHEGARMERVASRSAEQGGREPEFRIASGGYFASLGLKMVRGREFTRAEEESQGAAPVAIVDEALARHLFGRENPIGQMIRFAPNPERRDPARLLPMQIVGIAPPVREELTSRGTTPHIYVPMGRHYRSNMHVHIRTAPRADMASMLNTIRSEIRASNARLPVLDLTTMQGFHDRSLELWVLKAGGKMFTLLGLLALTLAVVGVYGVKSYMVSRRTREIGIRMALGAEPRDVLWMMLRDGLALTGAGLGVGIPLAALMSLALSKVLYDVVPFDPVVFAIAPAVLAATALVASVLPARRATRVAPVRALRSD